MNDGLIRTTASAYLVLCHDIKSGKIEMADIWSSAPWCHSRCSNGKFWTIAYEVVDTKFCDNEQIRSNTNRASFHNAHDMVTKAIEHLAAQKIQPFVMAKELMRKKMFDIGDVVTLEKEIDVT